MIDYKTLPVYQNKEQILNALEDNQVIIVESPTGSGKTTQIPLILHEAGYSATGVIGVTQPRRIAAMSVCEFIKGQIHDEKSFCGYTMRFYDTTDSSTCIKIMTDGILLQEVKDDPLLSRYSVIMVDEAHERTLNIDFILGLLKEITAKRPDLKVIISSATINTKQFSEFFDNAPIVSIDGRLFPVEVKYIPFSFSECYETTGYSEYKKICELVYEEYLDPDGGDVLVFLPGEAEIKDCIEALKRDAFITFSSYQIYPLFGRLSKEEQERVLIPTAPGKTKVVVATNIAETSLTIDGIKTVVDAGMVKINYYNQRNFTSALITRPISKASADQRKGRAGRTQNGTCYRLYSEENYNNRPEFTEEQILHSDLAEVVLRMSELGIYNPETFPFITAPKQEALISAVETLKYIEAISDDMHLTAIGEMMIKFPLLPRLSRVVVESLRKYPAVISPVLTAVSFLSTKGPFVTPENPQKIEIARNRQHKLIDNKNGDFVAYLDMYKTYNSFAIDDERKQFCEFNYLDKQTMDEIVHIRGQLRQIVADMGIPVSENDDNVDIEEYLMCLASGLKQYICRKETFLSYRGDYYYGDGYYVDNSYYTSISADRIYIHPGSSWFDKKPKYILAGELVATSRLFARAVSPLKSEWINTIDPNLLSAIARNKIDREEERRVKQEEYLAEMKVAEEMAYRERFFNDIKSGVKADDIIPLTEVDAIKERSDTEVYFSCNGYISVTKYPLKYFDYDLSFIVKTDTPEVLTPEVLNFHDDKYKISEKSSREQVEFVLSKLFRPCVVDGHLEYLTLQEDYENDRADVYCLTPEASILNAVGWLFCIFEDMSYTFKDTGWADLFDGLSEKIFARSIMNQVEDYEKTASSRCFSAPLPPPPKPVYYEEEQAVLNGISSGVFNDRKVWFIFDLKKADILEGEEIYTYIDSCISRNPVPYEVLNKEYNLVLNDCRLIPEDRMRRLKPFDPSVKNYNYKGLLAKLENRILKLYAPKREDGFSKYFDYIYLKAENGKYCLGYTPDVKEAVTLTYDALQKLYPTLDETKKGYPELSKYLQKTIERFAKYCEA